MINPKSKTALEAYTEKVRAGLVEKPVTLDPIEKAAANPKSLRMAINAMCYDCVCGNRAEVSRCEVKTCPLYQVRPWQRN
jgi:hydroxyethylthiazole kinase-like sugar kinase family protein